MNTTIDRAGRIVVPKALRDRLGLSPGVEIEIEPSADGLHLRVRGNSPAFLEKEGLLVHHGGGDATTLDSTEFINRLREARSLDTTS